MEVGFTMLSLGSGNGFWQTMYVRYDNGCPLLLVKLYRWFSSDFLLLGCCCLLFYFVDAPVWIPTACECLFSIFLFSDNVTVQQHPDHTYLVLMVRAEMQL